jgi:protein involved in polysaccharide export with SLBB domain
MGSRIRLILAFGLMISTAAGCSTVGETLGLSRPANQLSDDAKILRSTVPMPPPVPRELALELQPPHIVVPGDTLLVQPVELDAPVRLPPDQPVQPDGTIDLGQYGRPVVAGMTLPQVEKIVADLVTKKEKTDVAMTVRLLAKPSTVFYVLGEVNAPGAFPITGSDTVLSGITQAGGPTRRASEQSIVLSRPTTPEGCRLVYPVCYTNIVQLGDTTTNYQLQPGDRIYVPSKGMFEDLFARCRGKRDAGPCSAMPQLSCYGAGGAACAPTDILPTAPVPTLPPTP